MTPYYSRIYNLAIRKKVFYRLTSASNQIHWKIKFKHRLSALRVFYSRRAEQRKIKRSEQPSICFELTGHSLGIFQFNFLCIY